MFSVLIKKTMIIWQKKSNTIFFKCNSQFLKARLIEFHLTLVSEVLRRVRKQVGCFTLAPFNLFYVRAQLLYRKKYFNITISVFIFYQIKINQSNDISLKSVFNSQLDKKVMFCHVWLSRLLLVLIFLLNAQYVSIQCFRRFRRTFTQYN